MKDYWSELQLNECWSQKERYNILISTIVEKLSGHEICTVSVSVTDGTDAVANVDVTITDGTESYTGKTGDDGGCTISNVPYGTYDVIATATGYETAESTITIDDDTEELSITLTASEEPQVCTVSVSVTDGNDGVGNVDVTITDGTEQYTGKTGNAGGCTISNVPYGEYSVTAVAEGYTEYEDTITINSETQELSIVLVAETEPGQ